MNINLNINFDRILKFSKALWVKVGSEVISLIREDAKMGIFQTDDPVKTTYSKEYAELKANDFRTKPANGKGKGERIKQYRGVSIASTNTSFVDMTASGQTLRGLHIIATTDKGVTLSYQAKDIDKIVKNQEPRLNRRLVGLRKRNKNHITKMIEDEIDRAIKSNFVGKTTININM